MKWLKAQYTEDFICPKRGYMVTHNGCGGCDYEFCPLLQQADRAGGTELQCGG